MKAQALRVKIRFPATATVVRPFVPNLAQTNPVRGLGTHKVTRELETSGLLKLNYPTQSPHRTRPMQLLGQKGQSSAIQQLGGVCSIARHICHDAPSICVRLNRKLQTNAQCPMSTGVLCHPESLESHKPAPNLYRDIILSNGARHMANSGEVGTQRRSSPRLWTPRTAGENCTKDSVNEQCQYALAPHNKQGASFGFPNKANMKSPPRSI